MLPAGIWFFFIVYYIFSRLKRPNGDFFACAQLKPVVSVKTLQTFQILNKKVLKESPFSGILEMICFMPVRHPGGFMKQLHLLVWITQLGLSTATPLVGFILLAIWLRDRFCWGNWVIWIGIVLGDRKSVV